MKTHNRGSAINFEAVFTSSAGTILQVTAATLSIQHPLDGFPLWEGTHTTEYEMTNTSTVTGMWEYNWNSDQSGPGYVSWHIRPGTTAGVVNQGKFLIKSGPAATWALGPSTVAANDE